VQFVEANHGKTWPLDAHVFGRSGIAKMVETLANKEEVLETQLYVDTSESALSNAPT
jgi:hypothetical protein